MAVAKEQIRQIISQNNLNSVADVYSLIKESFKDILQELMEAELDASLGYEKNQKGDLLTDNKRNGHSQKILKSQYGEFQETDEWLRHKIRTIYWKQWKKVKTKFKELKKLGVEEEKAWICANMRNGNWYCGGYVVLQTAFNNKKLRERGYPTFTEFYLKVCEN